MIELKSFIILVIIVVSLSYILLKMLIKQKNQSKENNDSPDYSQAVKQRVKVQKKYFKNSFIRGFGWLLIIIWLLLYISPPAFDIKYPQGYPHTLSFKHMVFKPIVIILNDIFNGYWEDAAIMLIIVFSINAPFLLGLAIIFPKHIKKLFDIIFYPFNKVYLLLKRFSVKQSISILENNFGLGIYRLLLVVWLISFTISLILGFFDDDDYILLSIALFIFYWPSMIVLKRAYIWIKDGFDRDNKSDK